MKRFCIVILFILSVLTTSALGQGDKVPNLWVGIQANVIPAFQVNSIEHAGTQSQGIIIAISDFEQSRFGVNFQLFRGFDSAVYF